MLNNKLSTLKTIVGYIYSLLERFLPLRISRNGVAGIYNYLPIDHRVVTSGQPTEGQFVAIKEAGFMHVINLAPENAENALKDEQTSLRQLGINYLHIPVDFAKPSERDYKEFCAIMKDLEQHKVWVHCAANMRVSAFMYRYRCSELNEDIDLNKIWEPFGVWQKFVNNTDNKN